LEINSDAQAKFGVLLLAEGTLDTGMLKKERKREVLGVARERGVRAPLHFSLVMAFAQAEGRPRQIK